jgi:hypothetical protein
MISKNYKNRCGRGALTPHQPIQNRFALLFCAALASAGIPLHAQSTGIYVNSSNNVGIGTIAPVQKLHLLGPAGAPATSGTTQRGLLRFEQTTDNPILDIGVQAFGGGAWLQSADKTTLAVNYPLLLNPNGGNVGIGTTTPVQKLHLLGPAGAPATSGTMQGGLLRFGQTTDNAILDMGVQALGAGAWLQSTDKTTLAVNYPLLLNPNGGTVGIGTTRPIAKLQVGGYGAWGTLPVNTQLYLPGIQQSDGSVANSIAMGVDVNANATMAITTRATTGDLYPIFMDIRCGNTPVATFTSGGNVGIGTTTPGYLLDVAGAVHASAFVAPSQTYADFVFKSGYKLVPLTDVETAIKKDGHLPGIPSEAEAKAHGIDLASMQVKLLQKIEELTLHQIEQQKLLESQTERLDEQSKRIGQLEKENTELRAPH